MEIVNSTLHVGVLSREERRFEDPGPWMSVEHHRGTEGELCEKVEMVEKEKMVEKGKMVEKVKKVEMVEREKMVEKGKMVEKVKKVEMVEKGKMVEMVEKGKKVEQVKEIMEMVDVVLSGGAPWGFTLRGGLEYQEPLLITKVEEGSPAASALLQVGDEIVCINAVALSGYRQEAICLVKSSYKTLALGLKRRNEPLWRPHSCHSSKVSENFSEVSKTQVTAALEPVWQTKYDSGSSSNDFTSCWGQTNLQRVSCQFSSVGNMENLEHASNKLQGGADQPMDRKGVSKHDSAYSSHSFGTPDQSLSKCSTAPPECMFYRGSPTERNRYLQIPINNGGRVSPRTDDQTCLRFPSHGRLTLNPAWHIPEKQSAASSPPPPPPPLRSDSFAATKVHEKGLAIPCPQGPTYSHQKSHSRVTDRQFDDYHVRERGSNSQCSYTSKKDFLHAYISTEECNPNQLNPNKPIFLSSTDVRQGQNLHVCQPQHQRQHSDEGPFYINSRNISAPTTQSVGSYYRSLQHLPTKVGAHNQAGSAMASHSITALDHNPERTAHFRYYCITSQQPTQVTTEGTAEDGWKSESETRIANDWNLANLHRVQRPKYPPQYLQTSENKSTNDHCKQKVSDPASEPASSGPCIVMIKSNSEEREKEHQWRKDGGMAVNQHSKHVPNPQAEQRNASAMAPRDPLKDPWVSRNEHKICPQKTPLLHSLAQESRIQAATSMVVTNGNTSHGAPDPSSGKQGRRSDRYATTLRNEIQEKRAQLQKSRSAAALTCPAEAEDASVWRSTETSTSSSDGSFTNTYKDHLKEAQARVLQATSFKRKDLELPGSETFPGQSSMKPDSGNGHVSRIGSRKRFPMDKRIHSFSEPDKINEVGVEDKAPPAAPASFVDRCKFFEGASKPTFSKPISKKSHLSHSQDTSGDRNNFNSFLDSKFTSKQHLLPSNATAVDEQQRLGTFAEYEATWNRQKKTTEGRTSSRYRSAENILDSGMEESKNVVCIHERSRSSPSADFYGGKINLPAQKAVKESQPECKLEQEEIYINSPEREPLHLNISEPPEIRIEGDLEQRDKALPLLSPHFSDYPYPHHLHSQGPESEKLSPLRTISPEPQNTALPTENELTQPETSCPSTSLDALKSCDSQEEDPHPAAAPESECRLENELYLSSSLISSSSPATVPSAYGGIPPKLQDDPLGWLQDEDLCSNVMENTPGSSCVLNKVPLRDVHAESSSETESRHYMTPRETSVGPDFMTTHKQDHPCSSEQIHALSRTYTHPGPPKDTDSFSPLEDQTASGAMVDNSETVKLGRFPAGHSEDDEKREELARDIMGRDKSLVDILDQSKMKTTMDLMEGLYPQEAAPPRRKASLKPASPKNTQERNEECRMAASVSVVTSSAYYSTSAPKAELLIKMKDMQEQMSEQDSEDDLDCDLSSKKQELINSLSQKLQVLREARESLQEDMQDNNALGEEVEATVQAVCKPNELDKFRMFVGDLDKVVSLLLSLSGRLARVENALNNLEEGASAEEKHTLTEKRKLLIRQHEDAKELKENLDRRERLVYDILASYLSEERLADYRHFVKMKSALIIEQRKLEDRIKLGEEQLKCLKDSLPLEQRLHC